MFGILSSCENEEFDDMLLGKKSIQLKFIVNNNGNNVKNEIKIVTNYKISNGDMNLNSDDIIKIQNVRNEFTGKMGSFFTINSSGLQNNFKVESKSSRCNWSVSDGYFFDFDSGCFIYGTMVVGSDCNVLFTPCGWRCNGLDPVCLDDGGGSYQWA